MDDRNQQKNGLKQSSLILSFLSSLSASLSGRMSRSSLGGIFMSAEKTDSQLASSAAANLFKRVKFNDTVLRPCKNAFSKSTENSLLVRLYRNIIRTLLDKPLRTYGIFSCFLGLFISGLFALNYFGLIPQTADVGSLISGAMLIIFGLPLIFTRKTLVKALTESGMFRSLFIERLGLEEQKLSSGSRGTTDGFLCFLLALIIAAVTMAVPFTSMLIATLCAVGAAFLLCNPEAGLLCCFLLLPVAPPEWIKTVLFVTVISYIFKLLRGKRNFKLTTQDIFVLMLFVFRMLLALTGDTDVMSAEDVALMFGYFLAVNLLRTEKLLKSAFLCVCLGFGTASTLRLLIEALAFFGVSIPFTATLQWGGLFTGDLFMLAAASAVPMMFGCASFIGTAREKTSIVIWSLLTVACSYICGGGNLWATVTAGILLYILLAYKSRIAVICVGAVLLPTVYSLGNLIANPLPPGSESSLYSVIMFENGAVGVALAAVIFLLLCQTVFSAKKAAGKSRARYLVSGAAATVMLLAAAGIFTNLQADSRIVMLFWLCAGLIGGARNVYKERSRTEYE